MALQDGEARNMSQSQRHRGILIRETMVDGTGVQSTSDKVDSGKEEGRTDRATASSGDQRLEARSFAPRDQGGIEAWRMTRDRKASGMIGCHQEAWAWAFSIPSPV